MGLVALGGCDSQNAGTPEAQPSAATVPAAPDASSRWTQDLWLYERVSTFDAAGVRVELIDEILANLPGEPDPAVPLPHGGEFHAYPELRPWLSGHDGVRRQDVDVVAGILRTPEGDGFAVLATPHANVQTPIGLDDSVEIDLTFLDKLLTPGDPLSVDFAFLQTLPGSTPAGATSLEVLGHRMAEDRVQYYGEVIDGQPVALVYEGTPGTAVRGSTRMRTPAKADPMMDGFRKGVQGCRGGLRCVRKFFQKFGGGAASSNNLINCNLGGCTDPTPWPQPTRCKGSRCGKVRGDPHVTTFDGARLSMQAVGEFVGVRTPKLEVQFRTAPLGTSRTVSIVTAVAMDVDGVRVVLDASDRRLRAWVDGEPVALKQRGEEMDLGTGTLAQFHRAVQVVTADGHRITASNPARESIDLTLELADGVEAVGMFGNHNGDADDDMQTRDGHLLAQPVGDIDVYQRFVPSWRVSDEESLFPYGAGESTATFSDLTFPDEYVSRSSLSAAALARAEAVCREAGITEQALLDECIFDYAVSGDMSFVWSARRSAMLADATAGLSNAGTDTVTDAMAGAGAETTLGATDQANGPVIRQGLTWTIRHGATGEVLHEAADAGSIKVKLPGGVHDVSVQRVSDGARAEGQVNVAGNTTLMLPIVVELDASVKAPETAAAGSTVWVAWTGPDEPYDHISVARPGAADDKYENYTRTEKGNPLQLLLPAQAGEYEVRYVSNKTHKVLARQPITVTAIEASLDIPATAVAGSTLRLAWTGPDYPYDYISVATPGTGDGKYVNYTRTEKGNPLQLLLPAEAGTYEVRYVQNQGDTVLARATITTTAVTASLDIPATAAAGSTLRLAWTGPDYPYDYISVATPGTGDGKYVNYTRTEKGNPLQLLLPAEAGTYEVRYVQNQGDTVLARAMITTTAVTASLDIPATAAAGSTIRLAWSGPDYPYDYISVARPGTAGGKYENYTRTGKGNPLQLLLPAEAGTYEVRYVQNQGDTVLARETISVMPASSP
ncbi:hypothetical protein N792_09205 [Lysobacter concretionis Ko07 = DSM 16239]|uniref:VWFD domain-containing protein n=1 Tax=Lysobacter concretionis Ko07 = DSM 16239 TaxID=1122185 RepID=A0A0A0ENW0_9GAMM|nr:hypothetical protein N792_09205 [Lysobacter concretionis Ko07 = DSM 16239]